MQRTGWLVPVAAAEFGQPQRQFAVASEPVTEDQYMPRAVHRLDGEHPVVAAFGNEHVLSEVLPMAGRFPQAAIEEQRPPHLLIAGSIESAAQVSFNRPVEGPALGMPENAADRLLTQMEKIELAAEPPMVAAFCFFELEEVFVEFLLACEGSAVDPLQLGILRIATPISAGDVHQLECLAEIARRG